jgi:hypothetical protein
MLDIYHINGKYKDSKEILHLVIHRSRINIEEASGERRRPEALAISRNRGSRESKCWDYPGLRRWEMLFATRAAWIGLDAVLT